MSRLDELIAELCPDGVEYKKFGDIATIVRGGSPRPIHKYITTEADGINWIKIGDVNKGGKYITSTKEKITREGVSKSRYVKAGDFILSNSMSFGRPYILKIDGCIHDGWLAISDFSDWFIPDFLYHLLSSNAIQKILAQKASNGTVQNLNADIVKSIELPVPPLPVQQEIVRILDKFTALEAELEAELEARKKQYEYYLDQILSYEGRDDVRWMMLGEVCTVTDNINWRESQEKYKYIDLTSVSRDTHKITETIMIDKSTAPSRAQKLLKKDDIIFATTRPTLRRFAIITDEYDGQVCSTGFCVLRANQKDVLPKWIYYNIAKTDFYIYMESVQKGSAYPAVSDSDVKKYKIPIPPLVEQERIVAILDRFDALVNDITQGLPAEIAARRKQYEYYRDKLLTIKPYEEAKSN